MSKQARIWIIAGVWLAGVGSCFMWGRDHLWVAGLGVMAVAASTIYYTTLGDVSKREKDQYTVAGVIFLLFGILLLYIGIKNP